MADKYQREFIVLWEQSALTAPDQMGRLVPAPAGFNWMSYPEFIEMEDKKWQYVGTMDAVPYYRPA